MPKKTPPAITWNGVRLGRDHAFLPTVADIVEFSKTDSVVKVGIVGDPGDGKTTLAQALTHALHVSCAKEYGARFSVECFYYPHMRGADYDLAMLKPGNYIITLDDFNCEGVSFKAMMKRFESAVRSMQSASPGTRAILICTYFDSPDSDPYHRKENFQYFMGKAEDELRYIQNATGEKFADQISSFTDATRTAPLKGKWSMALGDGSSFRYDFKKPFVPYLFWDGKRIKCIVAPTRQFMAKRCRACERWEDMRSPSKSVVDNGYTVGEL